MPDTEVVTEPTLINEKPQDAPKAVSQEEKLFGKVEKLDVQEVEQKKPDPEKKEEPKPEAKKPEEKKEETKAEPSKPSPGADKAPVDYENLKLPNGSLLSTDELAEVKKVAKENGMTLEEAQGVLDVKNDAVSSFKSRQDQQFLDAQKSWKESWSNDPDYGGEKLKESTELAKRAWNIVADPELKTWADQTGLGNNHLVLRMMARIGKLFAEDTLKRGSLGPVPSQKSPEEKLYGKTTPVS